jgi:4-phospho-D-threonate 3-dehydrogenase / 4-phospho-D-erythronate 3-dehydrogenase
MRRLAISTGDPAGIGPEVAVRAAADPAVRAAADVTLVGDRRVLAELAERLGVELPSGGIVDVGGSGYRPGEVGAASGHAAVATIRAAVAEVTTGRAEALVSGPISKQAFHAAGYAWPGQTEALADICGTSDLRVMLVGGGLRVAHVSAHVPLARAVELVTTASVLRTIELSAEAGRWLALPQPRIAVLGLNPHAGEGGILGDEDVREIAPAVEQARADGLDVSGPESADTLYPRALRGDVDIIVAMYHDQGHVPVKLLAHDAAVAVTLGLPFLRTAADHGAAPDVAARGGADARSMIAATLLAGRGAHG